MRLYDVSAKTAFFACFWAYVRQPHGHIGWAKSMPLQSINVMGTLGPGWHWIGSIFRLCQISLGFDPAIQTACQKEAYADSFITNSPPQAKWIHHLPTWPQGLHDILLIHEIFAKQFCELADFFFQKKKNIFASSPWKLVKISWVSRMGRNYDDYPGFQPKITPPKHFSRQCIIKISCRIIWWSWFWNDSALLHRKFWVRVMDKKFAWFHNSYLSN